ncbi:MAG: hypothetical protein RR244_05900 [Oscillospiraceae bacterium]
MDFALSFIAILAISLLLVVRFKFNAALAPFASIAAITLLLTYLGTLDLLVPATIAVFALTAFSLYYCLWVKRGELRETAKVFFTPGMAFFVVSSLVFLVALSIKRPYFMIWDEFSFWGVAAKNVCSQHRLYTLFESSMIGISYPPGLPLFSYFMQCTSSVFTEWKVYLAYDIMMMSVMSMLFSRLKWKNYIAIPALSFASVSSLYLFWYSFEGLKLYSTSYSDVPLGVMFGAALVAWFSQSERKMPKYCVTMLALMLLPIIKDTGFAFALVAAAVISFDMIISNGYPSDRVLQWEKKPLRLVYPALLFVGVIASYAVWSIHLAAVADILRNNVPYEFGLIDMLAGRDPFFNEIWRRMVDALSTHQLLSFGKVDTMLIVFTLIPLVFAPFCKEKKNALRLVAASLLLLVGFFLYYLMLAYLYTAVFHSSEYSLSSYERYVSSYAIGWLVAIFGLIFGELSSWRFKRGLNSMAIGACALSAWALFFYTPVPLNEYVFTSDKVYQDLLPLRELMMKNAYKFQGAFTSKDRIYYACQDSNGGEWFYFNYEFQPAYTVQTLEGGDFIPMDAKKEGPYDVNVNAAKLAKYLREEKVGYVFVQKIDDYFAEEFAGMFADNLMGFYDGTASMYKVTYEGDKIVLVPVYSGMGVIALKEQYGY